MVSLFFRAKHIQHESGKPLNDNFWVTVLSISGHFKSKLFEIVDKGGKNGGAMWHNFHPNKSSNPDKGEINHVQKKTLKHKKPLKKVRFPFPVLCNYI